MLGLKILGLGIGIVIMVCILLLFLWCAIGLLKIILEEIGIIKGGYFGKEESHNEN